MASSQNVKIYNNIDKKNIENTNKCVFMQITREDGYMYAQR